MNDEPTTNDRLSRRALARTFADIALECETPLVAGIYGSWGAGKTTFLRLIESELSPQSSHTVWFNAWEHDQDDAPAVSLLHATVGTLGLERDLQSTLTQVALAFGSVLLQKTTTLTMDNLEKIQSLVDEENFRVRDARSKLHSYFEKVIDRISDRDQRRIVFFIDDLDRCSPDSVLRILEAIKLYFNMPGCIFFLGIDRDTIEETVRSTLNLPGGDRANYLDKMIQLPFFLPPVAEQKFKEYLAGLLPAELQSCAAILIAGLERNPRSVKRFLNNLILRHRLAATLRIPNYDPRLLTLLLLFEQIEPQLFRAFVLDTGLLTKLRSDRAQAEQTISDQRLLDALFAGYVPQFAPLAMYLSLTNLEVPTDPLRVDIHPILADHRRWLRSFYQQGSRCVLRGAGLSSRDLRRSLMRDAVLEAAVMDGTSLCGSDLRRATLSGANLAGADLSDALLTYCDLREADLTGANLRGADLRDADLSRANLREADLRFCVGLTASQIKESLVNGQTKLPIYLELPLRKGL